MESCLDSSVKWLHVGEVPGTVTMRIMSSTGGQQGRGKTSSGCSEEVSLTEKEKGGHVLTQEVLTGRWSSWVQFEEGAG